MVSVIAKDLKKSYNGNVAIENISFEIKENELFGFIGPDGAGKTTLFRILTTLLVPDTGLVEVFGMDATKDFRNLRKLLGYMPGKFSLYQDLSVEENLTFFATIFGTTIEENYELIRDIYSHIEPFKDRLAGKLSGGMKQKLALSCALIHKPRILILDEPTTGVDAVSRKEFWQMLKNLQQKNITIIVSTPYMDEAGLCDRVALIQKGHILKINTPDNIISEFQEALWAVRSQNLYKLKTDLLNYRKCKSAHLFGQYIHYTEKDKSDTAQLIDYLKQNGHADVEIRQVSPGIEDCFMELMISETNN
jgi:ABC-2 type transport system ATP-binding protein